MNSIDRSTLPAGSANASSLPRHMSIETQPPSLNESVGSNDSFQSQAPLPFHMAEDNNYPPRAPYNPEVARLDFEPSLLPTESTPQSQSSSKSRSLNPASREYIPTGNTPIMQHGFDGQMPVGSLNHAPGCERPLPRLPALPQPYNYGPPQQALSYHNGGPFPSSHGLATGFPPDPYAHYGIPNAMGRYNNSGSNFQGYGESFPSPAHNMGHSGFPPAQDHRFSNAPQHFNETPSTSSYNSGDYGSEFRSSGRPSSGISSVQTPGCQDGDDPSIQHHYVDENRFRSQPPSLKNSGSSSLASSRSGSEHIEYGYGRRASKNEEGVYQGGQSNVQPTQHSFVHPRNQHIDQSVYQPNESDPRKQYGYNSSHEGTPGVVATIDSADAQSRSGEVNDYRNGTSTGHNPERHENLESQNRPTHLRSRRGQSINTIEPIHEKTSTWLQEIPPGGEPGMPDVTDRFRSPPNSQSTALTLRRDDAFMTPTHRPLQHAPLNNLATPTNARRGNLSLLPDNGHSAQYNALTRNGTDRPSIEEALLPANIPFVEYCRTATPDDAGVIKIRNIPYSISRQEIMAFLGRNARLVSEHRHEPVHIVMERVTSKTLDCYVEFINLNEAVNAVQRFENNRAGGKGGRLGDRHVDVELSSQDQLMADLFPKSKNVKWVNGRPEVIPRDMKDKYNSGFAGFISKEEMVMLVKHVEAPQRSPFSKDCPQRPFECLISTLLKYPWYAVEDITIQDRNLLHDATKQLVRMLHQRVTSQDPERKESIHINNMLLKRVWRAVLTCPGFTPTMKDDIVVICELDENYCHEYGLPYNADAWRYLWTLGPRQNVPQDVLNFYIGLIRDYTLRDRRQLSLAEQAALGRGAPSTEFKLFGDLDKFIEYPDELANRTLAQVALVEWTAIEDIIRRALTPALH